MVLGMAGVRNCRAWDCRSSRLVGLGIEGIRVRLTLTFLGPGVCSSRIPRCPAVGVVTGVRKGEIRL